MHTVGKLNRPYHIYIYATCCKHWQQVELNMRQVYLNAKYYIKGFQIVNTM